ncbi:MAG TPA: TonB-dependent receptor [Kofleriaceae bacterium]|nr:TonB-dependent receptor [Kofleriaceae bacterium]
MKLALALLLVASSAAYAQPVPGSGDDNVREVLIYPYFTNVELPVLAMHGGNPEDTVLLFDGFELPSLFHPGGLRSISTPGAIGEIELLPGAFGVEYGRGSSIVSLSSADGMPRNFGDVTAFDATAHLWMPGRKHSVLGLRSTMLSFRYGWDGFTRPSKLVGGDYLDAVFRQEFDLSNRWSLAESGLFANDDARLLARGVLTAAYKTATWRASVAASAMSLASADLGQLAFDSRAEVIRMADSSAGLTKLEWRLGQQTNSSQFEFGASENPTKRWRHDIAGWSSIAANLSKDIRATVGLRVDNFNGDVATQPRGSLIVQPIKELTVALAAGAYRRPPTQASELAFDLNPERATHVAVGTTYNEPGLRINAIAYYIDRTRLVVHDQLGELHNTGFGTSMGVEAIAQLRGDSWFGTLSSALTRSKRFDYERAKERPAEYEQPFRLDAIAGRSWRRWIFSARLQLASGLPYTPYTGAVYNSDTDTYEPLYVPPLSARTPFHHQVDVRVDYRLVKRSKLVIDGFIDLHNAYRNRGAIGYQYSYDYSERTPITALPLFPFVGLRAYL